MWPRSENLQGVNSEWHEQRQKARENAFSIAEFGDPEITRFDLDTAGITGEDNPRSYTVKRPISQDGDMNNGVDVRELDRH